MEKAANRAYVSAMKFGWNVPTFKGLQGLIYRKIEMFIVTAAKDSYPTQHCNILLTKLKEHMRNPG
jgi:hypothetical protein